MNRPRWKPPCWKGSARHTFPTMTPFSSGFAGTRGRRHDFRGGGEGKKLGRETASGRALDHSAISPDFRVAFGVKDGDHGDSLIGGAVEDHIRKPANDRHPGFPVDYRMRPLAKNHCRKNDFLG